MGTYDTTGVGLKTPPSASQDWAPAGTYDVNPNFEIIDSLLTHHAKTYIVGPDLTNGNFPYLNDADTQMCFSTIQGAIDDAQTRFANLNALILVQPGTYTEHLTYNCDLNLTIQSLGGPAKLRGMTNRSNSQVNITGVVNGATDTPLLKINPTGTNNGSLTMRGIAMWNREFEGTGTGAKGIALVHYEPQAAWTSSNAYTYFHDCAFYLVKPNAAIYVAGFHYDLASISNSPTRWGGWHFDNCRFWVTSTTEAGTGFNTSFLTDAAVSEVSTVNFIVKKGCMTYVGGQHDSSAMYTNNDAFVAGESLLCSYSSGIGDGFLLNAGASPNWYGVDGGPVPTHGNNTNSLSSSVTYAM